VYTRRTGPVVDHQVSLSLGTTTPRPFRCFPRRSSSVWTDANNGRPADAIAGDDDHRRPTAAANATTDRTRTGAPDTAALLDSELHRPWTRENKSSYRCVHVRFAGIARPKPRNSPRTTSTGSRSHSGGVRQGEVRSFRPTEPRPSSLRTTGTGFRGRGTRSLGGLVTTIWRRSPGPPRFGRGRLLNLTPSHPLPCSSAGGRDGRTVRWRFISPSCRRCTVVSTGSVVPRRARVFPLRTARLLRRRGCDNAYHTLVRCEAFEWARETTLRALKVVSGRATSSTTCWSARPSGKRWPDSRLPWWVPRRKPGARGSRCRG